MIIIAQIIKMSTYKGQIYGNNNNNNNVCCTHTGPSWDTYHSRIDGGAGSAPPVRGYHPLRDDDDDLPQHFRGLHLNKSRLDVGECLSELKLGQVIIAEEPSYSFSCIYQGDHYLIKLPAEAIDNGIINVGASDVFLRYDVGLVDSSAKKAKIKANAVTAYNREFEIGKRIFDSSKCGADTLSYDDVAEMKAYARMMKANPGYAHVHKIEHYFPEVPCILSEYYSGPISDLMQLNPEEFLVTSSPLRLPAIWYDVAYQVGQAMLFLRDMRAMAHGYICPQNILYRQTGGGGGDGRYRFCLSDLGECVASSDLVTVSFAHGSLWSHPTLGRFVGDKCTTMQSSIFSYAVLLMGLLNFPLEWIPNIPDGISSDDGFYYSQMKNGFIRNIYELCLRKYDESIKTHMSQGGAEEESRYFSAIYTYVNQMNEHSSKLEEDFAVFQAALRHRKR